MKSLSARYHETHANTHETFADLMFCALIVLVLFVMTLAIEVSQRVRADTTEIAEVTKVEEVDDIETLSPEEVAELSERLQLQRAELENRRKTMLRQQSELRELRGRLAAQRATVENQMAALSGEQRFTGATEPAGLLIAYDYRQDRFLFIRQKEFEHATTRRSGESNLAYSVRSVEELVQLALQSRRQRYYTAEEADRIYAAFTEYRQINPTEQSYSVSTERLGVSYSTALSGFIAGDEEISDAAVLEVEEAINGNLNRTAGRSEGMYPSATVRVLPNEQRVVLNGVTLSAKNLKDLLLAMGGRGVMLDFVGYQGKAPEWLLEDVLKPAGYVGKTPKLPQ